jgi:hypothetical protein
MLALPVPSVSAGERPGTSAVESRAAAAGFVERTRAFMRQMAAGNASDARRIAADYSTLARTDRFADRASLAAAASEGRVRPLPSGAGSIRIRPRLTGLHPIGEMDLVHQDLYVAADAAAIECLIRIAASLPSGTLDVTSLVRHDDYQKRLARSNVNAARSASMHATGLAFDISVLNVPSSTARAIADVLLQMRAAGDLYFIAETQQLVFHIVPAASRLREWKEIRDFTDTAGEPARLAEGPRLLDLAEVPQPPEQEPLTASMLPVAESWTAVVVALLLVIGAMRRARRAGLGV